MELPKMKVYKSGMATFPSELREKGFEGELELTPDACAILIRKPKASSKDIVKSLEFLKAHFEYLVELEERDSIFTIERD